MKPRIYGQFQGAGSWQKRHIRGIVTELVGVSARFPDMMLMMSPNLGTA